MLQKRIVTALATGAIMLNLASPAFAGTTIQISGNGRDTDNDAVVNISKETKIEQNNTANISNNVDVDASTGGNKANDNLGGDVRVESGNATVVTNITNNANQNSASIECCEGGDTKVSIDGNLADSNNTLNVDWDKKTKIDQDNDAYIDNNVDVDATTGKNRADGNGWGDVVVKSGNASVNTTLETNANANFAQIAGGDSQGGDFTARIAGNGRDSDNDLVLDLYSAMIIDQDNYADVDNNVDVDAKTGYNKANDNLADYVRVESGNATAVTNVENNANFNWADQSCDCLFDDLKVSISDNLAESDNNLAAELDFKDKIYQDNDADFYNDIYADAKTGKNEASDNGSGHHGDPVVKSGNAGAGETVVNNANLNSASIGDGSGHDQEAPEIDFDFNFDFGDFLDWWSASHH